jgi:hypothetical protein
VRAAAGVPELRWHALRHYFKVTRRYVHPDRDRMLAKLK